MLSTFLALQEKISKIIIKVQMQSVDKGKPFLADLTYGERVP
jgi:hypothetical protein